MKPGRHELGARDDDALARDVKSMLCGTGPNHAQEWKDPDVPASGDP